jgi:hypothetical protein
MVRVDKKSNNKIPKFQNFGILKKAEICLIKCRSIII